MPSAPHTIEAVGVERRFGGVTALAGVSMAAAAGDVVLLVGPNGAGKTTLLRCLAGLVRPTRGVVRIGGGELSGHPQLRSQVGMLSHQAMVYDDLTPRENLRFAADLHGLADPDQQVSVALARVMLDIRADTPVRGFSRGMLQRLAIARATLHGPAVLLLDEPFTGLDASGALALRTWLTTERDAGRTQLCVTHDPGELWDLATRVIVMDGGRIVSDTDRPASLERFRDDYAAMIAA